MKASRALSLLLLLLTVACSRRSPGPILKLPSGREIRIIGSGTMHFSKSQPAWWLRYETRVPIDHVEELRAEALEVWGQYRSEADRSGHVNAALSANEPIPETFIASYRSYNFVFQKQADGTWKLL